MENLIQGIKGGVVYIDHILISGHFEEAHLATVEEVLSRLEKADLRLKRKMCECMRTSVSYLGHKKGARATSNS